MRHAIAEHVLRALLVLLVFSQTASAQTAATAQMNGTVKDQAGLAAAWRHHHRHARPTRR